MTNELYLFQLDTSKAECRVAAKMPMSETTDRTIFDSVDFFGPLLVARSSEDASLHLVLSDPSDQLSFMLTPRLLPAVYKMPECEAGPHFGSFFATDGVLLTVETCPGKILTIQSSLKQQSDRDENSWSAWFMRHALKVTMTCGLLGTGVYQYFRITNEKKAAAAKKAKKSVSSAGAQADEDNVPRRNGRGNGNARRRNDDDSDDDMRHGGSGRST